MSVDSIHVGRPSSRERLPGTVDVTGVPIRELRAILQQTPAPEAGDVRLERVRDRTYLVLDTDGDPGGR